MGKTFMRRILSGGAILAAGRLLGIASNFALIAILARIFITEDMGTYFLLFNIAAFLAIFSRFGVEQTVLKLFSDRVNGEGTGSLIYAYRQVLLIVFVASAVLGLAIFLTGALIANELFNSSRLASLILPLFIWSVLQGLQAVHAEIFRAFSRFALAAAFKGPLASFLTLLAVLLLWQRDPHVTLESVFFVINGVQLLVIALGIVLIYGLCFIFDQGHISASHEFAARTISRLAAPLFFNQLALFVATQSDIWLLQAFSSSESVAYYAAAARLVIFIAVALQIANAVLPPFISRLRVRGDIKVMEQMLRFVATVAGIPAIVIAIILMIFPAEILRLVYGSGYDSAAPVLVVLIFSQLVVALTGSCGYVLIMHGYARELFYTSLVGGIFSLSLALFLLMAGFGQLEVAFAYAFGSIIQQLFTLFYAKKKCGIYTFFGVYKWRL